MFNERGYFRVDTFDDLPEAIRLNEAAGAIGQAHLLRALRQGRSAYFPLLPDSSSSRFKAFVRATSKRPAIVLIGDDDGFDRGPQGWSLTGRAIAWSRHILIHGAGAEVAHYEAAILAAQLAGRCLIVECSSTTLPAWITLMRAAAHRPSTLIIEPREGIHPLPVDRRAMQ